MMTKKKKTIIVTDARDYLAQHFGALYGEQYDLRFLTSEPQAEGEYYWDPVREELDPMALEGAEYLLHMAGTTVLPQRLDVFQRNLLLSYRTNGIAMIGRYLMARGQKLKVCINASSALYYGFEYSPYIYTERDEPGEDFFAQLHQSSEEEAYLLAVEELAERSVYARFASIFCHYAGILPHIALGTTRGLMLLYRLGKQMIPWVHINDACRTLQMMIECEEMRGPYNCVAPEWVTYREIVEELAELRSGKQLLLHLPSILLRLFRGEYADFYLRSHRISNRRLLDAGFIFEYPELEAALRNIYDC